MSPMNRIIWQKAFRERSRTVTLRDGRKYTIRYTARRFGISRTFIDVAFIFPYKGYAPCGYFSMKKVLDKGWITESDIEGAPESKYVGMLDEFVDGNDNGVIVTEKWPMLEGKTSATLQRAFAQAKAHRGKYADTVQVIQQQGKVYLIREHDER